MKKFLMYLQKTYFGRDLDFRVRLFNVLAMTGIILSLITGITSVIINEGLFSTAANFSTTVIAFLLMNYVSRSGRYLSGYIITVIVIFMGAFSVLFFIGGGYKSAMPSYFIFAVIITVFMLEGRLVIIFSIAELILYTCLCLFAYYNPKSVTPLQTPLHVMLDVVIGYIVVSISAGAAMFLHFRMYKRQQRELETAREQAIEAKENLARQNAVLEQINTMKTEFLGNISHELKTPLTVISGYAQLSENLLGSPEKTDSSAVIEKMKFISSEAERLALMVDQVLDLTRIDEGRMIITAVPCHADEIIHSAIETYFPILNKNDNKLEIHIDGNLPMIQADPPRISQVIVNLIANSIRFTSAGTIRVSAKNAGTFAEISVSDTGTGISPERLPHIFDRYNLNMPPVRAGSAAGKMDIGTGLGLFICRHIIEGHGGKISVESKEGKGTVVSFTVPAINNEPC